MASVDLSKFFHLTPTKVLGSVIAIAAFVPFLRVSQTIQCVQAPCEPIESSVLVLQYLMQASTLVGINWPMLLIGGLICFLTVCELATFCHFHKQTKK